MLHRNSISEYLPLDEDAFDALAEQFLADLRSGNGRSISDYLAQYPQWVDRIVDVFPTMQAMEAARSAGEFSRQGKCPSQTTSPTRDAWQAGDCFGDFRIVREIGRGGMGIVFEVHQESLNRVVALKVLSAAYAGNPGRVSRFRREANIAARLHHTNIVPVYTVGSSDGTPFYSMQLIEGQSLAHLLEATFKSQRDCKPDNHFSNHFGNVARIGIQVADALAYSHAQGVLHRDVKPANLLMDCQGTVWITDFGLARDDHLERLTENKDMLGTLAYMAPEQFAGSVDHRTDVYALGATLYELLALRPPFSGITRGTLVKNILKSEATPLRTIDPTIPADLETIVGKAMQKLPGDRYATAHELADDLRRFVDGMPIRAKRLTVVQLAWRWCRRNRLASGLVAAILLMAAGLSLAILMSNVFRNQRDIAQSQQHRAEIAEAKSERLRVRAEAAEGDSKVRALLAQALATSRNNQVGQRFKGLELVREAATLAPESDLLRQLVDAAIECLGNLDLKTIWRHQMTPAEGWRMNQDLSLLAQVNVFSDQTVVIRGRPDLATLRILPKPELAYWHAKTLFSPDDRYLVVYYAARDDVADEIHVWDWRQSQLISRLPTRAESFVLDPSREAFVYATMDGHLEWWSFSHHRAVHRISVEPTVGDFCVSRDGSQIATADARTGLIHLFDAETGKSNRVGDQLGTSALQFSDDGMFLVSANLSGDIYIYHLKLKRITSILSGHTSRVTQSHFMPNTRYLLTVSWDKTSRIWNINTGSCALLLQGLAIGFDRDGKHLASIDGLELQVGEVQGARELVDLQPDEYGNRYLDLHGVRWPGVKLFSPTISNLMVIPYGDGIRIWDIAYRKQLAFFDLGLTSQIFFCENGRQFVSVGEAGIYLWTLQGLDTTNVQPTGNADRGSTTEPVAAAWSLGKPRQLQGPLPQQHLVGCALNGGRQVVFNDYRNQKVIVIDADPDDGKQYPRLELPSQYRRITSFSVDPSGRWLACGGWKEIGCQLWDLTNPGMSQVLKHDTGAGDTTSQVIFSPDGKWLWCAVHNLGNPGLYRYQIDNWSRDDLRGEHHFAKNGRAPVFGDDGLMVIADQGERMAFVDSNSLSPVASLPLVNDAKVGCLDLFGGQLVLLDPRSLVQVWNLELLSRSLRNCGLATEFQQFETANANINTKPIQMDLSEELHEWIATLAPSMSGQQH